MQTKDHFETLDGLRGLVALAVLLRHVNELNHLPYLAVHGYLGVDFFFVLSGFVIAFAYEPSLLEGMGFWHFSSLRLQRLYPLLTLGTAFGAVVEAGKMIVTHQFDLASFGLAILFGSLLVPIGKLTLAGSPPASPALAFPLNAPTWSLFYELLINLLYAASARYLTTRYLLVVTVIAAIGIIAVAMSHQSIYVGSAVDEFPGAFARVTFSFSAGVLICRFRRCGYLTFIPHVSPLWLVVVLLLVLNLPIVPFNWQMEVFCVLIIFPTVVALGCRREPSPLFVPLAKFSGQISYPLYMLHYPLVRIFSYFCDKYHVIGWKLVAVICAEVMLAVALAYMAAVYYDDPVRTALKNLFAARRADRRALKPR